MDRLETTIMKEIINEQYSLIKRVLPYIGIEQGRLRNDIVSSIKHVEQLAALLKSNGSMCTYCGEPLANNDAATEHAGVCRVMNAEPPDEIINAASTLGSLGGKSTSEAKRKASAENGKRGGRPKSK
jgi:hypothetical protein